MAKKSFRCKLVTPAAALMDDQVAYASVPSWDGLMGFLPGRAAFLGRLGMGELRLDLADSEKGQGGSRSYLLDGGFIRMAGDVMTILAERAVAVETLSAAEAEAELKAAALLKDPTAQAQATKRAKLMADLARSSGGKV
ncbi:MAG: F0F1 ATP synthase subunit epsilon [Planctomycetota bacterium]|nr:F0F1 ATP synthase subunit epsilon [Planctomycetota bacterium]